MRKEINYEQNDTKIEPKKVTIQRKLKVVVYHRVSIEKVATQLDEMGVLTKKVGKFTASTIRAMLRNIHYTGNFLLQK